MARDQAKRQVKKPGPEVREIVEILAAAALRGSLREAERAVLKRFLRREPAPRPDRPHPLDERFCPVCFLPLPDPRPDICPGCSIVLAAAWEERRRMLRRQKER